MLCYLCRRLLRWLDRDHAEWSLGNEGPAWAGGAPDAIKSWWQHGTNADEIFWKEQDQARLRAAHELWDLDPAEAFREMTRLAENASVWAMVQLGWAYATGTGTPADAAEAERWYQKASDAGSDDAMLHLGYRAYLRKDPADVEAILRPGIKKGLTPAMRCLANANLRLVRTPEGGRAARLLLEEASKHGDLAARLDLARARALGKFGWRDIRPGFRAWKAAASDMIAWIRSEHYRELGIDPAFVTAAEDGVAVVRSSRRETSNSVSIAQILFGRAPSVGAP